MTIRLAPAIAAAVVLVGAPAVAAQASTPTPTEEATTEAPESPAPEPEPAEEEETTPDEEAPAEEPAAPTEEPTATPSDEQSPEETPEAPEITSVDVPEDTLSEGEDAQVTVAYEGASEGAELTVAKGDSKVATQALPDGDGTVTLTVASDVLEAGTNVFLFSLASAGGTDSTQASIAVEKAAATGEPTETPTESATETPTESAAPSEDAASEEPGEPAEATEGPDLTVLNETIELRDFVRTEGEDDYGAKYALTGLTEGETYTVELTTPDGETVELDSITASEEGTYEGVVYWQGPKEDETEADFLLGDYTLTLVQADGEAPASGDFEVVANDSEDDDSGDDAEGGGNADDEPDLDASVSVSPDRLTSTDFVDRSKAVTITGKDFTPGASVTVTITPRGTGVEPFSLTRTVGEDGTVLFSVYGTNTSNPEVYVGTYDVYTTEDDSDHGFADSFTVTSNGQSGGGGSYLPQTGGADAGGLALGGALLALGVGALVVTRRKPKGIAEA